MARAFTIIMPLLLLCEAGMSQDRLKTPIKLNIEEGDYEGVSVVMKNNTTGETNSVPGTAKFELSLKINCDYTISFSKPGYITKKISLNTSAPVDRVAQGFYPFDYEVNLFRQYDGVNIVIFNQPVGKISYNRLVDDFDYDTDYTKQIQSALKAADEQIKKKQKESVEKAAQLLKEEEKKKAEEAQQAKATAKANQEAEKKAAEEAKLLAIQTAKDKKAQEELQKKEALAIADAERQRGKAQMEEEERKKAKAYEEEEERRKSAANTGKESPPDSNPGGNGEDNRPTGTSESGSENQQSAKNTGEGEDKQKSKSGKGVGSDESGNVNADPNKRNDKGRTKALATVGGDLKPEAISSIKKPVIETAAPKTEFEVLPDILVEEISEPNRNILRVTVRKNQKETIFSKVQYSWGGKYYFRQNVSISESLFFMNTGRR